MCGLSQLQRNVGIEFSLGSLILALGSERLSLAVQQVSQAARHEPHTVRQSAAEEVQHIALAVV